jgi:hypothetical protein
MLVGLSHVAHYAQLRLPRDTWAAWVKSHKGSDEGSVRDTKTGRMRTAQGRVNRGLPVADDRHGTYGSCGARHEHLLDLVHRGTRIQVWRR